MFSINRMVGLPNGLTELLGEKHSSTASVDPGPFCDGFHSNVGLPEGNSFPDHIFRKPPADGICLSNLCGYWTHWGRDRVSFFTPPPHWVVAHKVPWSAPDVAFEINQFCIILGTLKGWWWPSPWSFCAQLNQNCTRLQCCYQCMCEGGSMATSCGFPGKDAKKEGDSKYHQLQYSHRCLQGLWGILAVRRFLREWASVFKNLLGDCFRAHSTTTRCSLYGVSIHGGTPKSFISIGFSRINHQAIGVPPCMDTPIYWAFEIHGNLCRPRKPQH